VEQIYAISVPFDFVYFKGDTFCFLFDSRISLPLGLKYVVEALELRRCPLACDAHVNSFVQI
jgi:hypothetical protein